MKEKAGWPAPGVAFGPDAVLFVTCLARAVVTLLWTNPEANAEGLLPVPLATRAADSAGGLDFLGSKEEAAAAAVGSALDDTAKSTVKRERAKFVTGPQCTRHLW